MASVPRLDESTKAEKLALRALEFFVDSNVYVRTNGNLDSVFNELKLALRLMAVRNPNAQSHALRSALGMLIEGICLRPDSGKIRLDLLGLLIRMVDQKNGYKYNPMKHLAISGLGYLVRHVRAENKQVATNVYIVCLESWKVAPQTPETLKYRQTIIWTLTQAVNNNVSIPQAKISARAARSIIESSSDAESVKRSFQLLTELCKIEAGQHYMLKRLEVVYALFHKSGASFEDEEVRQASAAFYCASLLHLNPPEFKFSFVTVIQLYTKLSQQQHNTEAAHNYRLDGYIRLLKCLLAHFMQTANDVTSELDDWLAPTITQIHLTAAKDLFMFIYSKLTDAAKITAINTLLKLVTQAQPEGRSPKGSILLESTLACLDTAISSVGFALEPIAEPIQLATLGLLMNDNAVSDQAEITPEKSETGSNVHARSSSWSSSKGSSNSADQISRSNSTSKAVAKSTKTSHAHNAAHNVGIQSLSSMSQMLITSCLVSLVNISPSLLVPTMELCLKQFDSMHNLNSQKTAIAYVLSAMTAESQKLSLYSDMGLILKTIDIAVYLVKKRENFEGYNIAWILFSGIFRLGSDAVRHLVPQLLVLWGSHLSADACDSQASVERTLTGLYAFLVHNPNLVTKDVAYRIGKMLTIVWNNIESTQPNPLIRGRLLQCFERILDFQKDLCPASLLMKYVAHFSSTGSYDKGVGVAISSAILPTKITKDKTKSRGKKESKLVELVEPHSAVENGLSFSIGGCLTNDPDYLIIKEENDDKLPDDKYTRVVNMAVQVTAKMLPRQPTRIQESVLSSLYNELHTAFSSSSTRKTAVIRNVAKFMEKTSQFGLKLDDRTILVGLAVLRQLLQSDNFAVRQSAAEASKMIFANADPKVSEQHLLPFVKELVDSIISIASSDPATYDYIVAGSALSIGCLTCLYPNSAMLDTIERNIMPLAESPQEVVSVASLICIEKSLETGAQLDPKLFRKSIKLITSVFLKDIHSTSHLFQKHIALLLIKCVDRLGPLSVEEENFELTHLIYSLASVLQRSTDVDVSVIGCDILVSLHNYSRGDIDWSVCFRYWSSVLHSPESSDKLLESATSGLALQQNISDSDRDALWIVMDAKPKNVGVKKLLELSLDSSTRSETADSQLSCIVATLKWVQLLSNVVTKPRTFLQPKIKKEDYMVAQDEDSSLGVHSDDHNEQFSFEARGFALKLLLRLLQQLGENVNVKIRIVGDIVKLAFTAITSPIYLLQEQGLLLMNEIIVSFGDLPDPDFPQISLLEQYQVQIVSALSSSFAKDSTPSTALLALYTCGIVLRSQIFAKEKFSRLLKILEDSVDSVEIDVNGKEEDYENFILGSLQMTSNAKKVLQISVVGVWAVLRIRKAEEIGEDLLKREGSLVQLWERYLLEFARLSSPNSNLSSTSLKEAIEQMKDTLSCDLMEPVFQRCWMLFVKALAVEDEKVNDEQFAFMLYGLSIQALTTHEQSHRRLVLETLESLISKHRSFVDFIDELLPALYSQMLDNIHDDQLVVLKIVQTLAQNLDKSDENVDIMFEMVKITVLPLRTCFPHLFDEVFSSKIELEESNEIRDTKSDTKIKLVRATLNTMMDIVQGFPEIVQDDLWVCLIKIFEKVNQTEPSLAAPSFKRLLEMLNVYINIHESHPVLDSLLNSFDNTLSAAELQGNSRINSLLICTAILCTSTNFFVSPRALQLVDLYAQVLTKEINEQPEVGIPFIITVFKSCYSKPEIGLLIMRSSLPLLVNLAVNEQTSTALMATDALTVFAGLSKQAQCLAIVIPTIIAVANKTSDIEIREPRSRQQLMRLVTKEPNGFKQVVQSMSFEDTTRLQELMRANDTDQDTSSDEEDVGGITLTSFD